MLKKNVWILALLAALTFGFVVSCVDEPEPPPPPPITGLQVETVATWGAGLDLQNSKFAFANGDKIIAKGAVLTPADHFLFNAKPGAENAIFEKKPASSGTQFDEVMTLTAAHVTDIAGASPAGVRIAAKAGGVKFVLEKLIVMRGTTELFNLDNVLGSVPLGLIGTEDEFKAIFDGTGLVPCGDSTIFSHVKFD